jgi:hypothetical protein
LTGLLFGEFETSKRKNKNQNNKNKNERRKEKKSKDKKRIYREDFENSTDDGE